MTFNNKTIDELHDLLVQKEISALELTKATLEDIKSREGAVDAFLTIRKTRLWLKLAALDEKGIDADNVMAGIPLAVKDNVSTKRILTTTSKMLYNYEPIFRCDIGCQAYAKDMIIVGKTNMDEFAMGGSMKLLPSNQRKMLGIKQKFLVVLQVVQPLQLRPVKSVVIGFRHWWFDSSASIL